MTNLIRQQIFDVEGSNGVGKIDAFCYVNSDSIYTYSRSTGQLSLVDSASVVQWKQNILTTASVDNMFPVFPYPMTYNPLKYYDGKVVMNGFCSGETTMETSTNRLNTLGVILIIA